uniref:Uncharacterized protein n=1 Tax=Kalanchoe fedtschenkoi TaxID=63787 RepID=A0A7N1A6G0_KALFE
MYSRESSVRERGVAGDRKGTSFSSTLLDEIYRSIDDGTARQECARMRRNRQDEEAAVPRARLVEQWMEKKKKRNVGGEGGHLVTVGTRKNASSEKMELDKKLHYVESDPLFFSSGSTSSDSNSSLFSEHEAIPLPTAKTKSSCFLPPKPIRTSVKPEKKSGGKTESCCSETEHDEIPASAKSRALKLYAHLKKMKQPISPGAKLTTFINSILSNSKKPSKRAATPKPTCSSASSLTRSTLNHQTPPPPSARSNPIKRSVRFVPVNVAPLTRDELRHQSIEINRASPKPSSKIQLPKLIHTSAHRPAEDEDCAASDCSEDLFEIDHLKLGSGRCSGELPVYETTRVGSSNHNRVAPKALKL